MKARENSRTQAGFTLIELMLVVSIVAVLASLGAVRYTRYRAYSAGVACNAYMSAIQTARMAYAADHGGKTTSRPGWLSGYMATGDIWSGGDKQNGYGTTFRCPLNNGINYMFNRYEDGTFSTVNNGDAVENVPSCSNSTQADKDFPGSELHLYGGYAKPAQ